MSRLFLHRILFTEITTAIPIGLEPRRIRSHSRASAPSFTVTQPIGGPNVSISITVFVAMHSDGRLFPGRLGRAADRECRLVGLPCDAARRFCADPSVDGRFR